MASLTGLVDHTHVIEGCGQGTGQSGSRLAGKEVTRSPCHEELLIAVDLTPALPGGENGGAKVLAVELLKSLLRLAPGWRFLLLTGSRSHEEFARFDGPHVERLCVLQEAGAPRPTARTVWSWLKQKTFPLYQLLPPRTRTLPVIRMMRRCGRAIRAVTAAWRGHERLLGGAGLLAARGVDLLFCPLTAPACAEPGIPVVSILSDLQHLSYPQFFTEQELLSRRAQLERLCRLCDRIVCISEHTRQSLLRHLSLAPGCTRTIHINVQSRLRRLPPERAREALSRLGIEGCPYILYPANFWPHKNHRVLLVAYGMLLARNPALSADLVLTGALEAQAREVQGAARRMGLGDRVHFLGYLAEDDLAAVFEGCSMVVFPSLYEGFGISVLEGMYFEKPVACSNVTSLPEGAGDAALFFDPRKPSEIVQAVERIMADSRLASDLARRGHQKVRERDTDSMAREYLDLFLALTSPPKEFPDALTASSRTVGPRSRG